MDLARLIAAARALAGAAEVREYGSVVEAGIEYPLLSVATEGERHVVVTAGFHGDEIAGTLTLVDHAASIIEYARARAVGLRLYPMVNPSGLALGQRYNASGASPNNDFLRYEISPGSWKGELEAGESFLAIALAEGVPQETRALQEDLLSHPMPVAALDIHQDNFIGGAFCYAYVFGARTAFRALVEASSEALPVLRHAVVDSGYGPGTDLLTDADGLIEYHDGSITDLFHRRGVRYAAAIETTGQSPLAACHSVNLVWIRGLIDLAGSVP